MRVSDRADTCSNDMYSRIIASFVAVGIALSASPLSAQSLADVARKEAERRKAIKDQGKVISNQDLPNAPLVPITSPPPDAPAGSAAADAKPAVPDSSTKGKDDKDGSKAKDQSYWAARMKKLQDTLSRDEITLDAMQSRINALTTDFVNRDDPAQRGAIGQDRQKATAELERLKQAVADDKKAIADLEEEARRAGVPAGWLR